jgi:hypothetical protein
MAQKSSTLRILILTLLTFITLVKTQFASKVVMFEQCLAYQTIIIMCYSCQTKVLANWIPSNKLGQLLKQFVMPYLLLCLHLCLSIIVDICYYQMLLP